MKSLRSLFRIGLGPSSSHTMGPNRAAKEFAQRCHDVDSYRVTLYGSLAATGEGHMTDKAIIEVLEPIAKLELVWEPQIFLPFHPNGMKFEGIKDGKTIDISDVNRYNACGNGWNANVIKYLFKGLK